MRSAWPCLVLLVILSGCSLKTAQIAHASLQGGDLVSTSYAESRGAVEVNPLLQTSWPVRIALKSAVTVGVIYLTHQIGREHQGWAKGVLIAINSVMVGVIVNNVRVATNAHGGR